MAEVLIDDSYSTLMDMEEISQFLTIRLVIVNYLTCKKDLEATNNMNRWMRLENAFSVLTTKRKSTMTVLFSKGQK